jgi:hypothetical protein
MSGMISGRVVDASGAPVPGAAVTVTGNTPTSDIAALTDAGGNFRRGGLEPGSYRVDVRKTGQPPGSVQVDVVEGETVTLEVNLSD